MGKIKYPCLTSSCIGGVFKPEDKVVLDTVAPVSTFVKFMSFMSNSL